MIINWVAEKMRHFLLVQDAGLDELGVDFDFALGAEIMGLLYAQNQAGQQDEANATVGMEQSVLDEHEQALA